MIHARIAHIVLSVCLIFSIFCLLERPAYAYVDPGSGLIAFQAFSALIAGAIFAARKRIRNLLRILRNAEDYIKPSH